jgi:Lipid A 3-O-deacylase (PagL)
LANITSWALCLMVLSALLATELASADDAATSDVTNYIPSHAAEVRAGYLVGISFPWDSIRSFPEHGTGNLNAEFVAPKFFKSSWIPDLLLPRLRAGVMANLDGRTSYAYGGVLWTADITARTFGEVLFGGLVHNGQLGNSDPRLARLGCRVLYQVGGSFGYRLGPHTSLMVTFDHGSNGEPILSGCDGNEGIDVLGLRIGRSF